jgi:SAM-dependent methyltransferase
MHPYVFNEADGSISFGEVKIYIDVGDNVERLGRRDDVLLMQKSPPYLEVYKTLRGQFSNVLELGVYRGGSASFIHQLFRPKKLVCVDISPPVPGLDRYIERYGQGSIKSYYGVDQGDKEGLANIIEREFDGQIDLIVDDASHFYLESKSSFEATFPFLRHEGIYLLEDWAWSHAPDAGRPDHYAFDRGALTSLLFELLVAQGSNPPSFIEESYILHFVAKFRKGGIKLPKRGFQLENYMQLRGRAMSLL